MAKKTRTPPWRTKSPRKGRSTKLTAEHKQAARARAGRAGRHYPNLIDHMGASQRR